MDNIWNVSSYSASVYNSTVLGNGTVSPSGNQLFYYSFANANLPGNNISLRLGSSFYLETFTFINSRGFPEVDFEYNDGYGWITYDNAVFVFATQPKSTSMFLVDGNIYEPNGVSFYDAELILGGPGGGSQAELLASDVNLELKFWNGHNFQTIQNAFNFGSDTAEGVFNAISAGYFNVGGELFANIANGSGTLGNLWYSSYLTNVQIYTNVQNGTVILGGSSSVDFVGGFANLSIYPGTYSIKIYNDATGQTTNLGNHTFSAGAEYKINAHLYEVEFSSVGLPVGSVWYLNVSGQAPSGRITGTTYYVALINGTFSYTVSSSDKDYYPSSNGGSFTVNGYSIIEPIQFVLKTYQVTFIEQGLPSSQLWYVNLSNGQSSGAISATSYSFSLPNSSYQYLIETNDKVYKSAGGYFSVSGSTVYQPVTFTEVEYQVTFSESGLPPGSEWGITSNGSTLTSINSTITIKEPNGTYSYEVQIIHGYNSTPSRGDVVVNGGSISNTISWSIAKYSLVFTEHGIPNGTSWSVTLSGTSFNGQSLNVTSNSSSSVIIFVVPNGTYTYSIHLPKDYTATANSKLSGAINISGTPSNVQLQASENTNYTPIIAGVIVVAVIALAAIVFFRRKRS